MNDPTFGMIEFKSVARGIFATDAIAKKAKVTILEAAPIHPGKYMIQVCGEVANVEESIAAGVDAGSDMVINSLILSHIHPTIIPALLKQNEIKNYGALGILETFSVTSCVAAADLAVKNTPIDLVEIHLGNDLGGKGYFVITGDLADVKDSLEAAEEHIKIEGMLAASELIPNPHPELISRGLNWKRKGQELI